VERGLDYAHSAPAHTAGYLEGPLLVELGPLPGATFVDLRFQGAGRVPLLWKSLVASARRPPGRA
jgi:hypothetical protein